MPRSLIYAVVACAVALLAPSAAMAAPVIVDAPVVDLRQRLGKISAYGHVLAWSEYDAADATFHLTVQRAGQVPRRLSIAPRNRPFDVDAGPDRSGRPVLVYSRCRTDPKRPDPSGLYLEFGLPPYPGGSRCDLYEYSLASGRERTLKDISIGNANEFMPSIWRGRVAFVREYSPARPLQLYLNPRDGSGSSRLRRTRLGDAITSLDLRGRRVAYQLSRLVDGCDRSDVTTPNDSAHRTYISVVELRRKPVRVARGCNNDSRQTHLAGAVWSHSKLIYSADRGRNFEFGRLVARSLNGAQQTLAAYSFPNAFPRYLAVNDQAIYGMIRVGDGSAHISRLLDPP